MSTCQVIPKDNNRTSKGQQDVFYIYYGGKWLSKQRFSKHLHKGCNKAPFYPRSEILQFFFATWRLSDFYVTSNLCGDFSSSNTNLGFGTHVIMTKHSSPAQGCHNINSYFTSSPHVTLQRVIHLKKEKYFVANTEIGIFCTNLNVYTWIFVFCATPFKDRNLGW